MFKKYIKAFMAGVTFPAAFMSLVYTLAYFLKYPPVLEYPIQFLPLWVPWVFGLWNVLYLALFKYVPIKDRRNRYWFLGLLLGFIVAALATASVRLPFYIFGFTGSMIALPLLLVPIVYGLIWRYVIMYLNDLVGIKK